jgi:hypothetical protein
MAAVLTQRSPDFSTALSRATEGTEFSRFWTIGDVKILNTPLLGLLCLIRCPGRVIMQTYDLARALRDAGVAVIGGFHSPEKVWSRPVWSLAKDWGISDVGLAKICKRHNIPSPGLGYWAKRQAGLKERLAGTFLSYLRIICL